MDTNKSSIKPTFWQKITTRPECHEYMKFMLEMDRITRMNGQSQNKDTQISMEKRFTRYEYDIEINRSPYPKILSQGKNHDLRCSNDEKNCMISVHAESPFSSTFDYCIEQYADKFRI